MFKLGILLQILCACAVAAVQETVDLGYRKYRGHQLSNGLTEWLGIQYAAPPVGNLRWAAPQNPEVRDIVEDADEVRPRSTIVDNSNGCSTRLA